MYFSELHALTYMLTYICKWNIRPRLNFTINESQPSGYFRNYCCNVIHTYIHQFMKCCTFVRIYVKIVYIIGLMLTLGYFWSRFCIFRHITHHVVSMSVYPTRGMLFLCLYGLTRFPIVSFYEGGE